MKNWKTTLAGIGAAALNVLANGANWKEVLFSVAVAGLGLLAKDHSTTTTDNTQTPAK